MLQTGKIIRFVGAVVAVACFSLLEAAEPALVMEEVGTMPEMMSSVDERAFAVSADGEHMAYLKRSGSRIQVVVDQIEGPKFTKAAATPIQTQTILADPARPECLRPSRQSRDTSRLPARDQNVCMLPSNVGSSISSSPGMVFIRYGQAWAGCSRLGYLRAGDSFMRFTRRRLSERHFGGSSSTGRSHARV